MKKRTLRQIVSGITIAFMLTGISYAGSYIFLPAKEPVSIQKDYKTSYEQKNEQQREFTDEEVAYIQYTQKSEPERNTDYLGQFKLTAYCPCYECSAHWGTKTKSGTTAREGKTVAVDPNVIPLGSKVYINGNEYIAEDVGGAVKGNVIDIYFDSHSDVDNFGVTHANIVIEKV